MSRPHVVAAADRATIRDLELRARQAVEGLRQGLHRSPFHGFSAEFSQYRHYRPGDDLKYVDWKAFARTDRLYSRQFRETTNLGALFVVDGSGSMNYPADHSKFSLAVTVAAVLGTLVIDQGDAAGLLAIAGDQVAPHYIPARSGRHHLRVFLAALARVAPGGRTPVSDALRRAAALLKRRGMIVVLSDFYEAEPALSDIRRLARMGHDVIVIQTLAREELTLPRGGALDFEDLETGARLILDPAAIRDEYRRSIEQFLQDFRRSIEREGIDYLRLFTDDALGPALRRFLINRRGDQ